jgi:NAD(P)H dehydrogenase (quinone)
MTIVVTTPTGNVGSRVTRLLVQAGVRPRLLLRDPARLEPGLRAHVDAVPVDLTDRDAVLRATEGATALYWVCPPTGADDPVAAAAGLGETAARAVSTHGIAHTVFQSSVGAEKRSGAGDIDGLARTEEALDAVAGTTGAAVCHLRCGYFTTNLLMDVDDLRAGVLRTPWDLDAPMPWVDPRDVGDVAAARLLAADWTGRQVQAVHGPADLTWHEVAEVVSSATGHPVRVERISDDDLRAGLTGAGLTERQVEAVVGMAAGLRDLEPEDPRTVLTSTPTTLAAWAHEHLRPLLAA